MTQSEQTLSNRIEDLLDEENFEQAVTLLQNADEDVTEIRHDLIDHLIEAAQFDIALEVLAPLTKDATNPGENSATWTQLGFIYYYLDELADAQVALSTALKVNKRDVRALTGRSLVNRETDFARAATLDLERALMIMSNVDQNTEDEDKRHLKAEVYNVMADFAMEDEEPAKALEAFDAMVLLCPDDADYQLDLARYLSLQGELEKAIIHCTEAIEADELTIEAHLLRSYLQGAIAEPDAAIESARQALAIDDEEPYSHLQLASCMALKGDFDAVLRHAGDALNLEPDLADAHHMIAAALDTLGRAEEITNDTRAFLQQPTELPGFLYGERFDPYGEIATNMDELANMSPDQLQALTGEIFNSGMLPESLRPMMEQMLQNLPEMLQNMPPGMMDNLNPEMLSQLGNLTGGAPAQDPAAPALTLMPGGKDEE